MKKLLLVLLVGTCSLRAQTIKTVEVNPTSHNTDKDCEGQPNLQFNDITGIIWGCLRTTGWSIINNTTTSTPGGANTDVQINDSGALFGDSGFTYNKTTHNATLTGTLSTGNGTLAGEDLLYELTVNGSNYRSWLVPDTLSADLRLKFPDSVPTANQTLRFPAPTSSVSQFAWAPAAWLDLSNSWTAGVKQTFAPDATNSGLNVGALAGDVASPANGDIWYNSVTNHYRCQEGGIIANCIGSGGGGGGGGSAVAPYSTTVSSQTSVSISAATHGQGTLAVAYCYNSSTPRAAVACGYTRNTSGDLVFTFSPAFTGQIEIGSGGGISFAPYISTVTAQTSVSISAATHGKGTTPRADCYNNGTPAIAYSCAYTKNSSGDLGFTFSPAFTGTIEVRP